MFLHLEGRPITDFFSGPGFLKCSRSGCTAQASVRLLWNNPRVHEPSRRKEWLACPEHQAWLTQYLQERNFFKDAIPLEEPAEQRKEHGD